LCSHGPVDPGSGVWCVGAEGAGVD
jgi:hypothetical protein